MQIVSTELMELDFERRLISCLFECRPISGGKRICPFLSLGAINKSAAAPPWAGGGGFVPSFQQFLNPQRQGGICTLFSILLVGFLLVSLFVVVNFFHFFLAQLLVFSDDLQLWLIKLKPPLLKRGISHALLFLSAHGRTPKTQKRRLHIGLDWIGLDWIGWIQEEAAKGLARVNQELGRWMMAFSIGSQLDLDAFGEL